MKKVPRVYWDSSCFLAWLKREKGRVKQCEEVIRGAERGELQIVTSAITLVEVIKGDKGPLQIERKEREKIERFFLRSYILVVQVTRKVAEDARLLIWDYGLRPRDAVHVATALHVGLDEVHCYDGAMEKLDKKSVNLGDLGERTLKVTKPKGIQSLLSFEDDDATAELTN